MLDNCDLSGHFSKLSGNPAYRHSLQEVVGGCISCEGVHEDLGATEGGARREWLRHGLCGHGHGHGGGGGAGADGGGATS